MIYVVEDDRNIRELVTYALESSDYEVAAFSTAQAFYAALDPANCQLLLLDIMLPGEDGLTVLNQIRSVPETAHIPVVILSALGEERDKVAGLDLGADDYIAKPFGIMEFLARVRAQLRRHEPGERIIAPGVKLCTATRSVETDGGEISLTAKEFDLLEYLARRRGTVVRREELLGAVWGYTGGEETRTVDVHIRALRAKLGPAGEKIRTVRGVGYMLEKET